MDLTDVVEITEALGSGNLLSGLGAGGKNTYAKISQGKTEEQKKVIAYFFDYSPGCFSKVASMTDQELMSLLFSKIGNIDFRKRAIDKIGLDETQIAEIAPIHFQGFDFATPNVVPPKRGYDNYWRSSKYAINWMFFSSDQFYLYEYKFDLASVEKEETVSEFFYKDITQIETADETEEKDFAVKTGCGCFSKLDIEKRGVDHTILRVKVPGGGFVASLTPNEDTMSTLAAMKAKVREKKM